MAAPAELISEAEEVVRETPTSPSEMNSASAAPDDSSRTTEQPVPSEVAHMFSKRRKPTFFEDSERARELSQFDDTDEAVMARVTGRMNWDD